MIPKQGDLSKKEDEKKWNRDKREDFLDQVLKRFETMALFPPLLKKYMNSCFHNKEVILQKKNV